MKLILQSTYLSECSPEFCECRNYSCISAMDETK